MSAFKKYYIFCLIGTLAAASYPIYMGIYVISEMLTNGSVREEHYPKYIIPYVPIALAVIVAVALMPLLTKTIKKFLFTVVSGIALSVFFLSELLLESQVIVSSTVITKLESWQMFMCYVHPEGFETRTWRAVDVLIGEYSPWFKLHFYLISVVLILAVLGCLYGFAEMIRRGDYRKRKALIVQSVCTVLFLGLCIFACFTAFFRDGELTVSPISALLMSLFFIMLGVTVGTYTGSFLIGRKQSVSVWIPTAAASLITLAMYIGETFLLSGHLYRFGSGLFFDELPGIVLAPVDLFIILLSGCITAVICCFLNRKKAQ